MNNQFIEVLDTIKEYNKIIIIRHKNPDFDAYGSQFGLYFSLSKTFKDKIILLDGDDNQNNFFNRRMDKVTDDDYKESLVILVDQSSENMLNDLRYKLAKKVIIFDHHQNESLFGDLKIIRPDYSSTAELITEFLYEMNLDITSLASKALYIGIIGDSGRFYYKGTTANTFKMASILVNKGADIFDSYKLISKDEKELDKRFKGYVLSNFIIDKKVAYLVVDNETRNKYNLTAFNVSRGCVNLLSNIENIESFLLFSENDEGLYLGEFRSKNKSIVDIAKKHSGGGHDLACGATVKKEEIEYIIKEINEVLE